MNWYISFIHSVSFSDCQLYIRSLVKKKLRTACKVWIKDAAAAAPPQHLNFTELNFLLYCCEQIHCVSIINIPCCCYPALNIISSNNKDPRPKSLTVFLSFLYFFSILMKYFGNAISWLKTEKYKCRFAICLCHIAAVFVYLLSPDLPLLPPSACSVPVLITSDILYLRADRMAYHLSPRLLLLYSCNLIWCVSLMTKGKSWRERMGPETNGAKGGRRGIALRPQLFFSLFFLSFLRAGGKRKRRRKKKLPYSFIIITAW